MKNKLTHTRKCSRCNKLTEHMLVFSNKKNHLKNAICIEHHINSEEIKDALELLTINLTSKEGLW